MQPRSETRRQHNQSRGGRPAERILQIWADKRGRRLAKATEDHTGRSEDKGMTMRRRLAARIASRARARLTAVRPLSEDTCCCLFVLVFMPHTVSKKSVIRRIVHSKRQRQGKHDHYGRCCASSPTSRSPSRSRATFSGRLPSAVTSLSSSGLSEGAGQQRVGDRSHSCWKELNQPLPTNLGDWQSIVWRKKRENSCSKDMSAACPFNMGRSEAQARSWRNCVLSLPQA